MQHTATQHRAHYRDLGLISYQEAWDLQKTTVDAVIAGAAPVLLLCEHPAVLTLGRLGAEEHILFSRPELAQKGVEVVRIDRGGEVTLHSPGQLVIYPIFNLNYFGKDLRIYMQKLEQVAIDLLHDFGIVAKRIDGRTGVWVGQDKIASIGVGVRKWVSYHGLAININTDLQLFSLIRPCGLDVQMTSMARLLNRPAELDLIKTKIIEHFSREFHLNFTSEEKI
ncbi:MAG: lipoyl(octanoyl) transferase [Omnitrophica WOR_2 bacterium RIFCSPHIGHO2_01_FULL_48_9]|nr:MAG: lipoyl(octanoyl) transferase [Omnitrophica WOR_2 bacterium RIFCSPHIGHO2_01_FULL_48_9]